MTKGLISLIFSFVLIDSSKSSSGRESPSFNASSSSDSSLNTNSDGSLVESVADDIEPQTESVVFFSSPRYSLF